MRLKRAAGLAALAGAAVLVHGYHLGVDDAEIYVPGIKKAADPDLYPFGAEFFQHHANLSLFPNLVGDRRDGFTSRRILPSFAGMESGSCCFSWRHGGSRPPASHPKRPGGGRSRFWREL